MKKIKITRNKIKFCQGFHYITKSFATKQNKNKNNVMNHLITLNCFCHYITCIILQLLRTKHAINVLVQNTKSLTL
jgi:hypothetical protein